MKQKRQAGEGWKKREKVQWGAGWVGGNQMQASESRLSVELYKMH